MTHNTGSPPRFRLQWRQLRLPTTHVPVMEWWTWHNNSQHTPKFKNCQKHKPITRDLNKFLWQRNPLNTNGDILQYCNPCYKFFMAWSITQKSSHQSYTPSYVLIQIDSAWKKVHLKYLSSTATKVTFVCCVHTLTVCMIC